MREIPLSGGTCAKVDDEDHDRLNRYVWSATQRHNSQYAVCYLDPTDLRRVLWMHRLVSGALPGEIVDHIDGDGLNNMKANLRVCSNACNQMNRGKPKTRAAKASRYKGVSWHKSKWRAKIVVQGRQRHLGYFTDEMEAARAYDRAAREHFGEFAWTNQEHGLFEEQ